MLNNILTHVSQSLTTIKPIVLDVEGLTLNDADIVRLKHPLTGGIILFARNYSNQTQLIDLCKSIKMHAPDIIIFIDHEGGRVQRCKSDGFTHLPAMGKLGELYKSKPIDALKAAHACGYILAMELLVCGVDMSYTPVLDLDYGKSQVIGDRAFDAQPEIVAGLARQFIDGLKQAGMASCGKHFPGHGYVTADSHVAIPIDDRSLEEIYHDIKPYYLLDGLIDSIMPAHVIYEKIDQHPAGFSEFWLQTILRNELNFSGIIFSDDLSMEGASVAGNVVDGAKAALKAGCDMVLICNRPDLADDLLANICLEDVRDIKASSQRFNKLYPKKNASTPTTWQALQVDETYQLALKLLKAHTLINC